MSRRFVLAGHSQLPTELFLEERPDGITLAAKCGVETQHILTITEAGRICLWQTARPIIEKMGFKLEGHYVEVENA